MPGGVGGIRRPGGGLWVYKDRGGLEGLHVPGRVGMIRTGEGLRDYKYRGGFEGLQVPGRV